MQYSLGFFCKNLWDDSPTKNFCNKRCFGESAVTYTEILSTATDTKFLVIEIVLDGIQFKLFVMLICHNEILLVEAGEKDIDTYEVNDHVWFEAYVKEQPIHYLFLRDSQYAEAMVSNYVNAYENTGDD